MPNNFPTLPLRIIISSFLLLWTFVILYSLEIYCYILTALICLFNLSFLYNIESKKLIVYICFRYWQIESNVEKQKITYHRYNERVVNVISVNKIYNYVYVEECRYKPTLILSVTRRPSKSLSTDLELYKRNSTIHQLPVISL